MWGGAYLIAGGAARLQPLSVVPAAVDLSILVEVDEVHQELITHAAHEAGRVPAHAVARPGSKHSDVAAIYLPSTLKRKRSRATFFRKWFLAWQVSLCVTSQLPVSSYPDAYAWAGAKTNYSPFFLLNLKSPTHGVRLWGQNYTMPSFRR